MDVFCTHVFDIVFDLSMYEMLVLEFPVYSPMNKLSKTHRALWVFQLNIHGARALDPTRAGHYRSGIRAVTLSPLTSRTSVHM